MKKKKKKNKNMNSEKKQETKKMESPDIEDTMLDSEESDTANELNAEVNEVDALQAKVDELSAQVEKEKKEYHFLMAEFDNFRKRTLKEKAELIKNGAEKAMKEILPIIDDFERGMKAVPEDERESPVYTGLELIYNKFKSYLAANGVKEISPEDDTFDTEYHEAVTTFPTDDESKKGKIIDTVQKGYTLNDKVLRYAKVVVGE